TRIEQKDPVMDGRGKAVEVPEQVGESGLPVQRPAQIGARGRLGGGRKDQEIEADSGQNETRGGTPQAQGDPGHHAQHGPVAALRALDPLRLRRDLRYRGAHAWRSAEKTTLPLATLRSPPSPSMQRMSKRRPPPGDSA